MDAAVASTLLEVLDLLLRTQVYTLVQPSPASAMVPETATASTSAESLEPIHFKKKGQRKYQCPVEGCSIVAISSNGMDLHIRSIHTKEVLDPCHSCGTITMVY